jgi:hypothetical protein
MHQSRLLSLPLGVQNLNVSMMFVGGPPRRANGVFRLGRFYGQLRMHQTL